MKTRLSIIALSAAFLCASAHAGGDSAPSGADISAIEATYRAVDDLSADFVQRTDIELLKKQVTRKGTFRFKKGGKIRIEYSGGGEKSYVSDGTTLWTFVPGDEASLQTFAVNDRNIPREALSFMNGFGRLTKEFKVTASEAFGSPPSGTALRLTPRSKSPQYECLDALFGADRLLTELIVRNLSGNVSHYNFRDIRTNSGLADSIFTLSKGKATPDTLPE
jgi:outer membrane lipoprotein-sorting protein